MAIGAFFDLDYTLLPFDSAPRWSRELWRSGDIALTDALRTLGWGLQYKLSLLDMGRMMENLTRRFSGFSEDVLVQKTKVFFESSIRPALLKQARDRITWHRLQGHRLVLLTSAIGYWADLVGKELGFDGVHCTRLLVSGGKLQEGFVKPLCYGAGKVDYAECEAAAHHLDLPQSYFYSDSFVDLPMLQRVGRPQVVNPDMRLWWHAKRHRWPIHTWRA